MSDYVIPKKCEKCGSENIFVRVLANADMVRYCCNDCNYNRAVAKEENLAKRTNTPLEHWAKRVKNRFRYGCVICGSYEGLEAHHIIPVAHSEKYKYWDSNGVMLCKKCHWLAHHKEIASPYFDFDEYMKHNRIKSNGNVAQER